MKTIAAAIMVALLVAWVVECVRERWGLPGIAVLILAVIASAIGADLLFWYFVALPSYPR